VMKAGWLPGLLEEIEKNAVSVLEGPLKKCSAPSGSGGGEDAAPTEEVTLESSGSVEEVTLVPEGDGVADSGPRKAKKKRKKRELGPASPLDAALGLGLMLRKLNYNKAVGDYYENGLQPHTLTAPSLRLAATWYPAAHLLDGPLANVGISLSFYQTVGGSTGIAGQDERFTTTFSELNVGLRGRLPLDEFELGLNGNWGFQSLVLKGDNEAPAGAERGDPGVVPDTKYTYFRFGPDALIDWKLPIRLAAYYRTITLRDDDGYLKEDRWFPASFGMGIEGMASVTLRLSKYLGVEVGGEARYYGINANVGTPEDTIDSGGNIHVAGADGLNQAVAAGINDTYFGGFVSARYSL